MKVVVWWSGVLFVCLRFIRSRSQRQTPPREERRAQTPVSRPRATRDSEPSAGRPERNMRSLVATLLLASGATALQLSAFTTMRPAASARTSVAVMGLEDDIKETITKNKVVMYSKSSCPFCNQCKGLFEDKGILDGATVVELDLVDGGQEIQDALLAMTGQRTVPNVFVGGVHVGGNDDTQKAAKSGKLDELLASA